MGHGPAHSIRRQTARMTQGLREETDNAQGIDHDHRQHPADQLADQQQLYAGADNLTNVKIPDVRAARPVKSENPIVGPRIIQQPTRQGTVSCTGYG
jgi:hypothetical protein